MSSGQWDSWFPPNLPRLLLQGRDARPDPNPQLGLYFLSDSYNFAHRGVPVLYGLPVGHGETLSTLPLGVRATLDADARTLTIDEPALAT